MFKETLRNLKGLRRKIPLGKSLRGSLPSLRELITSSRKPLESSRPQGEYLDS
jgi:hypothetical protein